MRPHPLGFGSISQKKHRLGLGVGQEYKHLVCVNNVEQCAICSFKILLLRYCQSETHAFVAGEKHFLGNDSDKKKVLNGLFWLCCGFSFFNVALKMDWPLIRQK